MRLFVVDDNPDDRALVRREIERDHPEAEIVEIGTRDELEAALGGGAVDLAVLDYSLGWSNGLEVLQRIRGESPHSAAILFTGSLGEEAAVEMMKAGLDDYIVKEASRLPRLRASIHALLGQMEHRLALRRVEARYRTLFQTVTVGLFACRADGRFEDGNPALLGLVGAPDLEALRRLNLVDLIGSEDLRHRWHDLPRAGISKAEVAVTRPDGRVVWVLLDARPSPEGAGVEGVLTDVTALRTALDQKGVLLQEVFHRVYNNLQQVEALLNFQGRRFTAPDMRRAFKAVGDRIRALALVQQKLYQSADYRHVDFAAYLREVTDALLLTDRRPEITARIDAEPVVIPVEKALPLGLIANELIANSLNHAFPEGRPGEIRVGLRQEGGGRVLLTVADNGDGPGPGAFPQGQGLGSQLVPKLARQIDATFAVEGGSGFSTQIRFRV